MGGSIPCEGGKRRPEAGDSVRRPYGNPVTPFPVPAPGAEQTARVGWGLRVQPKRPELSLINDNQKSVIFLYKATHNWKWGKRYHL